MEITQPESLALVNALFDGVSLSDMAKEHGRTPREITYHFCELGILKWEAFNDIPPDAFDER